MIIDVLALGETIHDYDNADNIRIGVNDVERHYKCDHLIVLNRLNSFTPERAKYIKNTTALVHTIDKLKDEFKRLVTRSVSYKMDYTLNIKSTAKVLDIDKTFYHSRTSPFVAVMLAYRLGAKTIRLFGVDLKTHYAYSDGNLGILEARCWVALFKDLYRKKINLIIPKHSKLFNLWHYQTTNSIKHT